MEAKKLCYETGLKSVSAYGGMPFLLQLSILHDGVDLLVATPGRLLDLIERSRISLEEIKYLVIDEADKMLIDENFQVERIVESNSMPNKSNRRTMLFSATFPHETQKMAHKFLHNPICIRVGSSSRIQQTFELVMFGRKKDTLKGLLRKQASMANGKQPLTMVFLDSRREATELYEWLNQEEFPTALIHSEQTQQLFKNGTTPIMVATDVASRGLDIQNVAHVINYRLPRSIVDYIHRIGRTGRNGKAGTATAFFTNDDIPLANRLLDLLTEQNADIPNWLLEYARGNT